LNERAEDGFVVVADDEDFFDLFDFGDGAEAVLDDGVARDLEKWFLQMISTACIMTDGGITGECRLRGLKRVPRDGPPTRITALVVLLDMFAVLLTMYARN
jgi:hypothetical protein